MTATNHAVTGAFLAALIKEPLLAIPLSFAAHFAMDALPHFGINEPDVFKRNNSRKFIYVLVADVALAGILLICLPILLHSVVPIWLVFICMLACMSPDLVWGWHFYHEMRHKKIRNKKWFSNFHKWVQWMEFQRGAYIELTWLVLALYSILLIKSR